MIVVEPAEVSKPPQCEIIRGIVGDHHFTFSADIFAAYLRLGMFLNVNKHSQLVATMSSKAR